MKMTHSDINLDARLISFVGSFSLKLVIDKCRTKKNWFSKEKKIVPKLNTIDRRKGLEK